MCWWARAGIVSRGRGRAIGRSRSRPRMATAFRSPTVPGLGLASAGLTAGATGARGTRPPGEGALVKGRSLVNHWIEVAIEPTGALTLHDRRSGQRFTDLLRIEDGGDAGDTYTY